MRSAAALAALGCAAMAATVTAQNLTVDVSQTFQTIDGMGTNINVNSWKGGQLRTALDHLVDRNGCSLLRVVRDPMDWVSAESDITLLHGLDPATLTRIYEAPKMQDIWSTIAYLNQKGLGGKQIVLNFMGWTPPWLGGSGAYGSASHITAGKEPKFATMVASLVYYGRMVKGLDFTLLAPMNEPDLDGKEGPLVGAAQYVTVLKALITELDAMGLTDVRIVGPDTSGSPSSYISAMMADTTVRGRVDHLAFHVYGGSTSPGTAYSGKDYWLTEAAQWCSTCDQNGAPPQGEWAFAKESNDFFLQDLGNGLSSVLVWEGYDGFYYHHDSSSTWGLLAYNANTGVYTPRKRSHVNAQLTALIRPGAKRASLSTSVGGLTALAFYSTAAGRVSIVGHNTAGSPVTINGRFNNLPVTVDALVLYQTNSSLNFQRGNDVPVAGQSFSASIPADTFFSLANFTAPTPGAPHVTSISPVSGPTTGGTTVTIRGSGFVAGATVSVGGVAATGVVVADATSLTAVTGAHPTTGPADVTVTIPGPLSGTLVQGFFYTPLPEATDFYTLTPCRLVDTRGAQAPALAAHERRVWKITERCGVPATAKAVALNVAVAGPTAQGHIRLMPGNGLSEASSLNFSPGVTRANNAVAMLATDGTGGVAATNGSNGTVHLILDVNGYFE